MLNRHEISKLLEMLNRHLDAMKPHKNESDDLFAFRRQPYYDIVSKLNAMWHESKASPITLLTTRRGSDE